MTEHADKIIPGYLTVGEVADRLGISKNGVYKLIARGKLKTVRRSAHQTRVPERVLEAYQEKVAGRRVALTIPERPLASTADLEAVFEQATGMTASDARSRWLARDFSGDPADARALIQALALLAAAVDVEATGYVSREDEHILDAVFAGAT